MATVPRLDLDSWGWGRGLQRRGVLSRGRGGGGAARHMVSPGAERLGFAEGDEVEREPYNLLFGERKGPDRRKLGRAPANTGKAAEIYKGLLAAEPGADDHRNG